jgi:ABC-type phosphate transport system substrate-binding protein
MKKYLLPLLFFFCAFAPHRAIETPAMQVAIIVNKDNPIEKLSVTEVRLLWMRRGAQKNWPTLKTLVLPTDRKGSCAEKSLFYKSIVKLSESETDSYFAAKQYQAAETPPVKFNSDKDIIQYVIDNKAGLGYINIASLKDGEKDLVKMVCLVSD